jgi:hypothetical protein
VLNPPRGIRLQEVMMKRNVIATLLAALLVIGFLGLAAAQDATTGQDAEGFGQRYLVAAEEM